MYNKEIYFMYIYIYIYFFKGYYIILRIRFKSNRFIKFPEL